MSRDIWTGNFEPILPISIQDFDLSAALPSILYMFRFARRRGKGKFIETFSEPSASEHNNVKRTTTIESVAKTLADHPMFDGFQGEMQQAVLGDMLLCYCLENAKRQLGRTYQVQRTAAPHYMASWIDLPKAVANLRFVPEMIVALLADQAGRHVEQSAPDEKSWFSVGRGFENNVLLQVFGKGVVRDGELGNRRADRFVETVDVGVDELLTIRMAQCIGEAPDTLRGKAAGGDRVSNRRPIAQLASRHFAEDLRRFVVAFGSQMPRHAFVEMLESCFAIGMTTVFTSVVEIVFHWVEAGVVAPKNEQHPGSLFVDCSNGIDRRLQSLGEQSFDDLLRRMERLPTVFMAMRLLDYSARNDPVLKPIYDAYDPYATNWLNVLGDILFERNSQAKPIRYDLERRAIQLSTALHDDYQEAADSLRNNAANEDPVWRLAECLSSLQGRKNTQNNLISTLDSSLMVLRPNGLANKRAVVRASTEGRKRRDVRSLVLTDQVMDHLVHLHSLPGGSKSGWRRLSLGHFLTILHERYGFCIDVAPPGMTISNELLRQNRTVLERRLRDLGLLVGVNDAESMKSLKPRFQPARADSQ